MLSGPPRLIPFVFIFLCMCLVWWYLHLPGAGGAISGWTPNPKPTTVARPAYTGDPLDFGIIPKFSDGMPKAPGSNYTFKIVVPKTKKEDISWMAQEIPDAPLVVYEVDNPDAENKIPKNKGREAMVCDPRLRIWHMEANRSTRSTYRTSSTTTTTSPTRRSSCTPTATHGTTTYSWARTPPRW
jgi:hypothetical protein